MSDLSDNVAKVFRPPAERSSINGYDQEKEDLMEYADYKYIKDLESVIAKLGNRWKNLPIEEVIRFCTKFKVISSIKDSKFLVLKLRRK